MTTYYDGHETVYRRLEAEGRACWDRTPFDQFTLRPFLERALSLVGSPEGGARALDVGCGTGPVAAVLVEHGYDALGIDVSETAIRLADQRFSGVSRRPAFAVRDALTLDGEDAYDLVVDSHCLHCIVFDDQRRRFLATMHRLLKPGGALVVETMVRHDDVRFGDVFVLDDDGVLWVVRDESAADVKRDGDRFLQPQRRLLSAGAVRDELIDAGFSVDLEQVTHQEDLTEPWSYQAVARKR